MARGQDQRPSGGGNTNLPSNVVRGTQGPPGADGVLSIRKAVLAVAGGAGRVTWTYAEPFDTGVSPRVVGIAVNAGAGAYVVQLIGDPTETAAVFEVNVVTAGALALAANGTKVHAMAVAP
jgi:hypothetical protein